MAIDMVSGKQSPPASDARSAKASAGVGAWYLQSVTAVRLVLAVSYLLNGINWWVKILPFPNLFDDPHAPQKQEVVRAMIETGWMFGMAKSVELLTGLALLFNVWVPLMLVASMPVAVLTFLMDAMILGVIWRWLHGAVTFHVMFANVLDMIFFGGVVLAMQGYLMFAYLDHYRPMLALRGRPAAPWAGGAESHRSLQFAFALFAAVALGFGLISTLWLIGMVHQWAIPWSSLKILAHP